MSELFFNYVSIIGFCTLIVEAIILLLRPKTVEHILLNVRKKLLVYFVRVMILGFGIFLILYGCLEKDTSIANIYVYGFTFVISLCLSVALYAIVILVTKNIGLGKNYFIRDKQHGKLYLIKNTNGKYILLAKKCILLADTPTIKDSKFVLFKDGSVIENNKIYSEPNNR